MKKKQLIVDEEWLRKKSCSEKVRCSVCKKMRARIYTELINDQFTCDICLFGLYEPTKEKRKYVKRI